MAWSACSDSVLCGRIGDGCAIVLRTDYTAEALRGAGRSCTECECCTAPSVSGCGVRRCQPRERGADRRHGPAGRLNAAQQTELRTLVEAGSDRQHDGVVCWLRVDLQRVIEEHFGVAYHERHVSTLMKRLGFSHVSARPRHPGQDTGVMEAFKKTSLVS